MSKKTSTLKKLTANIFIFIILLYLIFVYTVFFYQWNHWPLKKTRKPLISPQTPPAE